MDPLLLLSGIVFLPAAGALVLAFLPSDKPDVLRVFTLVVTLVVLALTFWGFFLQPETQFSDALGTMQSAFNLPWIPSFHIFYSMGVDGISFPLIILTALVCVLAMAASWSITKYVKAYCILFLLLETGMLGVFLALDFFLFYVFWEVMLLPMYFLIGVWGGERREYAAIKFFLYTLVGSVLMLIAILMLYFNSDVGKVAQVSDFYGDTSQPVTWTELNTARSTDRALGRVYTAADARESEGRHALLALTRKPAAGNESLAVVFKAGRGDQPTAGYDAGTHTVTVQLASAGSTAAEVSEAINGNETIAPLLYASLGSGSDGSGRVVPDDTGERLNIPVPSGERLHSFNLLALAAMGQHTNAFSVRLQWWSFLLLFIGFIIKVPSVPLHTWLPDAHVQAPTPISMILAGILLKMGGYGIIRICYPICPHGGYDLMYVVCIIGVVSMVYGAFAALAQTDFKRLVAYSSVSHMGYVVLGLGVWSAVPENANVSYFWNMGVQGAMFQMIAHGISSSGMFFMVGVVYDRVHHRHLDQFGGLFGKMPVYTALSIGIFFAGLGLPGLCGFIGEVFVVLSVWSFDVTLAIISASVVILTAGYILWAIQRVYLGAEYKGPHEEALVPSNLRENSIAGVLFVLAILLGVFPNWFVLRFMEPTIDRQVASLVTWSKTVKNAPQDESPNENTQSDARQATLFEPARTSLGDHQSGAIAGLDQDRTIPVATAADASPSPYDGSPKPSAATSPDISQRRTLP